MFQIKNIITDALSSVWDNEVWFHRLQCTFCVCFILMLVAIKR